MKSTERSLRRKRLTICAAIAIVLSIAGVQHDAFAVNPLQKLKSAASKAFKRKAPKKARVQVSSSTNAAVRPIEPAPIAPGRGPGGLVEPKPEKPPYVVGGLQRGVNHPAWSISYDQGNWEIRRESGAYHPPSAVPSAVEKESPYQQIPIKPESHYSNLRPALAQPIAERARSLSEGGTAPGGPLVVRRPLLDRARSAGAADGFGPPSPMASRENFFANIKSEMDQARQYQTAPKRRPREATLYTELHSSDFEGPVVVPVPSRPPGENASSNDRNVFTARPRPGDPTVEAVPSRPPRENAISNDNNASTARPRAESISDDNSPPARPAQAKSESPYGDIPPFARRDSVYDDVDPASLAHSVDPDDNSPPARPQTRAEMVDHRKTIYGRVRDDSEFSTASGTVDRRLTVYGRLRDDGESTPPVSTSVSSSKTIYGRLRDPNSGGSN